MSDGSSIRSDSLIADSGGDIVVRPLNIEDAETVNSEWKFRDDASLDMIRAQISRGLGMGVYLKTADDRADNLVSWIMCRRYAAILN